MAMIEEWDDKTRSPQRFHKRSYGWDTSFPSNWTVGGLFLRTDESTIYRNSGTFLIPVWTSTLIGADESAIALIIALS